MRMMRRTREEGVCMKMRSLALALGILSYGALAQAQRWVVPPHVIDVTGAQPVVAALPGNPPLPYRVANGVVDQSGNVQFYVVAGASPSPRPLSGRGARGGPPASPAPTPP